jgi:hypothetical protein
VYTPAAVTVIEVVVSPSLHSNEPAVLVCKVDVLLQLFIVIIEGATGIFFGAAEFVPKPLVQPNAEAVTLYEPTEVTVIEVVVAPVFQSNEPVEVVDKTEDPQLFATVITGVPGVTFGFAVLLPAILTHPFTVCVTVYTPAENTVTDVVVAPVLQFNEPVAVVDKIEMLPHSSVSDTEGIGGATFGAATPAPAALVQPFTVVVT